MILELTVGAGLVAAATYAFRALKHSGELEDGEGEGPLDAKDGPAAKRKKGEKGAAGKREATTPTRSGPRGLRVGDVLLYGDDELWLAGCFEVWEDGFVCRAFATPGSARASWVLQLDAPADELALGQLSDAVPEGAVPAELPVDGLRLRLRRRGEGTVRKEGDGLPFASEKASYVLLRGPGGKHLLVLDFDSGDRLSVLADAVGRELLDLLPGGDASSD